MRNYLLFFVHQVERNQEREHHYTCSTLKYLISMGKYILKTEAELCHFHSTSDIYFYTITTQIRRSFEGRSN